jgi:hypothetical protein
MRGSEYYPDIMLRYVAIGQTARPAELNGLRQESPLHPLAILSLVSQMRTWPCWERGLFFESGSVQTAHAVA